MVQSKSNKKSSFARNSGPYHGASVLLNKLLQKSDSKQKYHKHSSSSNSFAYVGGLKSLVFVTKKDNTTEMVCSKSTYATLCQTLQSKPLIEKILEQCPPSGQKKKKVPLRVLLEAKCKNIGLLYILLHELLFSKFQKIKGGGGLKRVITQYEPDLRKLQKSLHLTYDEVQQEKEKRQKIKEGNQVYFPRYARVNTIKATLKEVTKALTSSTYKNPIKEGCSDDNEKENSLLEGDKKIYLDNHIPHLLVLPPEIMKSDAAKFYSHALLQEGKLILQDKASCFSALALIHATTEPSADKNTNTFDKIIKGDILDACAAPGNKTSHLAALLTEEYRKNEVFQQQNNSKKTKRKKNKNELNQWPKVIAFDRDQRRFKILKSRMELLVSTSNSNIEGKHVEVHPVQTDFLQALPSDAQFKNVKSILLDPSCSGSGIVTSPDRNESFNEKENKKDQKERILSLAKFQITCLRHAMSFPQVERIVYSTCSIHDLENEGVVASALGLDSSLDGDNIGDEAKAQIEGNDKDSWELIAPASLAGWKRRGNAVFGLSETQAKCLVRCDALAGDDTNGFFVSCLQRKRCEENSSSKNEIKPCNFAELMHENEDVSIPFYNGEFKKMSTSGNDESNTPNISKETYKDVSDTGTKKEVIMKKKKQKKLLWKKRQSEQKQARLKAKKQK